MLTDPTENQWILRATLSVLLLTAGIAGQATAADPSLLQVCLDCHRGEQSRGAVPALEGQHAAYLSVQLTRFQERHRSSFPMSSMAAGLEPAQIDALAAALAARPWQPAGSPPAAATSIGASQLEVLDCASCHGADYRGGGVIPRIAGQQAAYLERQIIGFADAERYHPPVGGGSRMYGIDPAFASAIAATLSALR
jgi:cytochrome c553